MINDILQKLHQYLPNHKSKPIVNFLNSLSVDMEDGVYPIDGDDIYAKVMTYPTQTLEKCKIEAHNIYRDIQFTLIGAEGISLFSRNELQEETIYDSVNDCIFFNQGIMNSYIRVINKPGYFTMILPNEAHRPQEAVEGESKIVKKCVIKIRETLWIKS